jgi:hypothetical protein
MVHVKSKAESSGEKNCEDCKNGRSQESDGHFEEHGLPQVWQADAHREAGERPRAGSFGGNFYFLLGLRVSREVVAAPAIDGRTFRPRFAPWALFWRRFGADLERFHIHQTG